MMIGSTRSKRRLWKRLSTPLALALLACALSVPAQALAGGPVSEKTAGLWSPPTVVPGADDKVFADVPAIIVRGDDKVLVEVPEIVPGADDKVLVPPPAAALHPDSRAERPGPTAGTEEPTVVAWGGERLDRVVTGDDRGVNWPGLGIALAVSLATILTAAALVLRRRRGLLAHQ